MRHIRFLNTTKTVCNFPNLLGTDFVVVDYEPFDTPSCHECGGLLMAYNEREDRIDKAWSDIVRNYNSAYVEGDDPLSPARGVVAGLALASGFWIMMMFLIWTVWFR